MTRRKAPAVRHKAVSLTPGEASKFPVVEVCWVDILSDPTWRALDDIDRLIEEANNDLSVTYGLLIKETDRDIVLVATIRPYSDRTVTTQVGESIIIPRAVVKQMKIIRKARMPKEK
jgi:hypothetical protein